MRRLALGFALLVLVACSGGGTDARVEQALTGSPNDEAPLGALPAEPEQLLERRDDGAALFGTVLAAPLGGDPERVMTLRATVLSTQLDGRRVLDARFARGGVLTLGADHVLRWLDADGTETELDAAVEAPLSVAGARVAYARGEMPFFELARADLTTGRVEALTEAMAPVWSPALSPGGDEVVFATSASGHPMLVRRTADGTLVTLGAQRTPSSPRAPRWIGDVLTFEDESGTTSVDVAIASTP